MRRDQIQKAFGARVKVLRLRAGLSQESLAAKAGIDRSYMGAVERGERNITLVNICRIAVALSEMASSVLDGVRV